MKKRGHMIASVGEPCYYLVDSNGDWITNGVGDLVISCPPTISCAYPLDDDGTLAASFGYGYAGPAVAPNQQGLSFTSSASGQSVLLAADTFGSARFSRPASGPAAVFEFAYAGGTMNYTGLLIIISDAGGTFINSAQVTSTVASLLAITVAADGTVAGFEDGVTDSLGWSNGAGQKTVGATDKYALGIFCNATAAGQTASGTLHSVSTDMTGTYTGGETDPCGTVI